MQVNVLAATIVDAVWQTNQECFQKNNLKIDPDIIASLSLDQIHPYVTILPHNQT